MSKLPIALAGAILLLGCAATSGPRPVVALTGTLRFGDRHTQATSEAIATGALVALVDSRTGNVLATSVSATDGTFTLFLPGSAMPDASQCLVLEASKGLGLSPNQAGGSMARLRTLLFRSDGAWHSLTGSDVSLDWATTTVAAIASLEGLPQPDLTGLIGRVGGGTFRATGSAISLRDFQAVATTVQAALAGDQDPLAVVTYDPANATSHWGRRPAPVGLFASALASASAGETLTFQGIGLPDPGPGIALTLGGQRLMWQVAAGRTSLAAQLPGSLPSSRLQLQIGATTWPGPLVRMARSLATFAGNGTEGGGDGPADMASLSDPEGIAVAPDGTVYVSEPAQHLIRQVSPDGWVSTLVGDGTAGHANGAGSQARFSTPRGLAWDAQADALWVADTGNACVRRVTRAGVVTDGASGSFSEPTAVAVAPDGALYVLDHGLHQIWRVAGLDQAPLLDSAQNPMNFPGANALALDSAGAVYVSDTQGSMLYRVTPGSGVALSIPISNPGPMHPSCLAGGSGQRLYVADSDMEQVWCYGPNPMGGPGIWTSVTDQLIVRAGGSPLAIDGLAVDPLGALVIADGGAQRLRLLMP